MKGCCCSDHAEAGQVITGARLVHSSTKEAALSKTGAPNSDGELSAPVQQAVQPGSAKDVDAQALKNLEDAMKFLTVADPEVLSQALKNLEDAMEFLTVADTGVLRRASPSVTPPTAIASTSTNQEAVRDPFSDQDGVGAKGRASCP